MSNDTQVKMEAPERIIVCTDGHKPSIADWAKDKMKACDFEYVRADLLASVRREEREAAFKEMIGAIAVLPSRGTMNYRRGYEEGVRDALRTLESSANSEPDEPRAHILKELG